MVHREAGKGRIIPENFQTFPATAREPLATAREPLACDRLIRYNLDKVYNRHEQTSPVKYELK